MGWLFGLFLSLLVGVVSGVDGYSQEMAWREANRRMPNGDQISRVARLAMVRRPSLDFSAYWQRHKAV